MRGGWKSAGRPFGLLACVVLLARCGEGLPETGPEGELASAQQAPATQTLVFTPTADARVTSALPNQNFGLVSALTVDTTPAFESHLKFNVSGVAGQIVSAKLRLFVFDGTDTGPVVYRTQGAWTETGITWNNRPQPLGVELDRTEAPLPAGTWMELDVTQAVRAHGEHSFVLAPQASDSLNFRSKEHGDHTLWPRLVVTVEPCMTRTDLFQDSNSVYVDAHVAQDAPGSRFGEAYQLHVDASPRRDAYLQFYVFNVGQRLHRAVLRLRAQDSTNDGPKLYRVQEPWPSYDPSWNDRPTIIGGPIGDAGAISAGSWVEYDVTSIVVAGPDPNTYSFALVADSADDLFLLSQEGADHGGGYDNQPMLVLTWETAPYCWYRGNGGGMVDRSRQLGATDTEEVFATALTPSGELILAGTASAGGDFGNGAFAEPGMVIAKYASDGTHLWSRSYGDAGVRPTAVTVTPQGNVLVAGTYEDSPDLGTGWLPPAGTVQNMFILKLSPSGSPIWAQGFGAGYVYDYAWQEAMIRPQAVATDANGSLIVTGAFFGFVDFGGGAIDAGSYPSLFDDDEPGMFLAKFSWEGTHLWSQAYSGGPDYEYRTEGLALATDGAGNIILGGSAGPRADFGSGPLGGFTSRPFVAMLTPAGQTVWSRTLDGATGGVDAVALMPDGRVAFAGHFARQFTFAGRTYVSAGAEVPYRPPVDLMLGTLTASGQDGWLRQLGNATDEQVVGLGVDSQGRLALGGKLTVAADLGGGILGTGNYWPAQGFVARYAPAGGAHLWSRTLDPDLQLRSVAALPDGQVMAVGSFQGAVQLAGQTFTSRGSSDVLLLRLTP